MVKLVAQWILILSLSSAEMLLEAQPASHPLKLSVPKGHGGIITTLKITSDGKFLLSASYDRTIKLWDLRTGLEVKTFMGHTGVVTDVALSPRNKNHFVSAGRDNLVILWDMGSGKVLHTFSGHDNCVESVDFSEDGTKIISGGQDLTIKMWDVPSKSLLKTYQNTDAVSVVKFIPGEQRFLSGSGRQDVKLWNAETGQVLRTYSGHEACPTKICLAPQSSQFIAATEVGEIKSWMINSSEQPFHVYLNHQERINGLDVSRDGRFMISVSEDNTIVIWNLNNGSILRTIRRPDILTAVAISPDNKHFFTSEGYLGNYENYTIHGWDIASGAPIRTFEKKSRAVEKVHFTNNGAYLLAEPTSVFIGRENRYASIWDRRTGKMLESFIDSPVSILIEDIQSNVTYSVNGKYVAEFGRDTLVIRNRKDSLEITRIKSSTATGKFDFSPVDDLLAVAEGENIDIWNLDSLKIIAALTGHAAVVEWIQFSPDGMSLLSGSADNTMRLWDITGHKEISAFILLDSLNWISVTPDNYYYGSRAAVRDLGFSTGLETFSFEQYDLLYNRPDKVLRSLGQVSDTLINMYYAAYRKRLEKMHFTEAMLATPVPAPELEILTDTIPVSTPGGVFEVSVFITDSLHNLDRINVSINDVPVYGLNGIDIRHYHTRSWKQTLSLLLNSGSNKIQISALNQAGAESLKKTFYIYGQIPPGKPDLYVVALGVGRFSEKLMNLSYPQKDVQNLVEFLQTNNHLYRQVVVDTFTDERVTYQALQTIRQKLKQTQVEDHIILFVAGHGLIDENLDYYFATSDVDFNHPKVNGITYETLENLLDSIPARKKLILMDACHAGEIDKENVDLIKSRQTDSGEVKFRSMGTMIAPKRLGLENSFELMRELFVDLRRGTGATVIASAGGMEFAVEGEKWQNSVFTYALISGLKSGKADLNKNGAVMVSELQQYLAKEVSELTSNQQRPTFRLENITNDWRVW